MDREQVLAFRLARSGLARRDAGTLAEAAATPASDFSRDAALLALSARRGGLTREVYDEAVDRADEIVVAHSIRGAIHALRASDLGLFGRALIATDDDELGRQLGHQVQALAKERGFAPTGALAEVAQATADALAGGRALSKNELRPPLPERLGSRSGAYPPGRLACAVAQVTKRRRSSADSMPSHTSSGRMSR